MILATESQTQLLSIVNVLISKIVVIRIVTINRRIIQYI